MRVECEVAEVTTTGTGREPVSGMCVSCLRCGHNIITRGTETDDINRALTRMRSQCPRKGHNTYVVTGN